MLPVAPITAIVIAVSCPLFSQAEMKLSSMSGILSRRSEEDQHPSGQASREAAGNGCKHIVRILADHTATLR